MKIVILEGARGTGKSTLAKMLREKTSPTPTLINFTGFHDNGKEGLKKVSGYYNAFSQMLVRLHNHNSEFIFDRFFFSEMVYSKLYKDYDFTDEYYKLCNDLEALAHNGVKIEIIHLTTNDENVLNDRLTRDKVPFANVKESVSETIKQQNEYTELFDRFYVERLLLDNKLHKNLQLHRIDTSKMSINEVYNEILKATN